jgi:hypothetical protein
MASVMSVFVLLAGVYVALVADTSGPMRVFGGVLILIGAASIAATLYQRRVRR